MVMIEPQLFRNGSSILITSGIERARLQAWLDETHYENVVITLEPQEERRIASVTLPVTLVRIEGAEEAANAACAEYMLRFLSAGG